MTAEAVQTTLDLGDYRGQKIKATKVKLANASDGFDPSTSLEAPRIYEVGEILTLAVEVIVTAHTFKATSNLIEDEVVVGELLQTFKCGTMAVIPRRAAAKELDAAQKAVAEREKAKKAAKPKVRRATLKAVTTDGPKKVGESLQEALNQ